MADAILWQVMENMQKVMREEMSFGPAGNDQSLPIDARNIMIRKDAGVEHGLDYPAIVITPARRMNVNPAAGTNVRDDYPYPVLVQILDRDSNTPDENLRTHLKWREQIARSFQQQKLDDVSEVYISAVTEVDYVDARLWKRHDYFVGGVECRFMARLTRGADT